MSVPGFYAGDGNAAETSASSGGVWRVIFSPPSTGKWDYKVHFRKGQNIATDEDPYRGTPIKPHDNNSGSLIVTTADPGAGFHSSGRLQYTGSRYLHTQNGEALLKFGANSPENFLAYADIDGTYSYDPNKNFLKTWTPHIKDWKNGDPTWQKGKGKGIIGALNYLASKGMNSVYALTLNIEGDARDVWPFLSHQRKDFKRYDVSKLAQWDIIFSHAEKLGIIMHLVTQEKENELILDDGNTAAERKLYYRELIARFGYHNNIIWNMGEENGAAPAFWPQGQNDQQRFGMIRYIKDHDPYKNPVVIHTMPEQEERKHVINPLLKFDRLDGLSMQISDVYDIHHDIGYWVEASKKMDRQWIVMMDEIGRWHTGTRTDQDDPAHDTLRQEVLWGTLMAGGAGVEWYFGWLKPPHDLNAEDWRSRNNIWEQSAIAHSFFSNLPYTEMKGSDELLKTPHNYCFSKSGETYALYLKKGGSPVLDLRRVRGDYSIRWFDPRNGGELLQGSITQVKGGEWRELGLPPNNKEKDWAVLVQLIQD